MKYGFGSTCLYACNLEHESALKQKNGWRNYAFELSRYVWALVLSGMPGTKEALKKELAATVLSYSSRETANCRF